MSENPYTPPSSQIFHPPTAQGQAGRPWQVVLAIGLAAINFGMGLVVSFATRDRHLNFPSDSIPPALLSTAILVWIYYKIYLGRNWARITMLLLYLASILILPVGIRSLMAHSATEKTQLLVSLALNAASLCLLFISPGRHWFRRRTANPPHGPV